MESQQTDAGVWYPKSGTTLFHKKHRELERGMCRLYTKMDASHNYCRPSTIPVCQVQLILRSNGNTHQLEIHQQAYHYSPLNTSKPQLCKHMHQYTVQKRPVQVTDEETHTSNISKSSRWCVVENNLTTEAKPQNKYQKVE